MEVEHEPQVILDPVGLLLVACYVAVPPDPTDKQMEGVWATLRTLTQDAAGPQQTTPCLRFLARV